MKCAIEDCNKLVFCKGMCHKHYRNGSTPGNPKGGTQHNRGEARLWLDTILVTTVNNNQCILWPYLLSNGYGKITHGGKQIYVSHLVLELTGRGPKLEGMLAAHSCDTPACVAPWHLAWSTYSDNRFDYLIRQADKDKRGRRVGS